MDLLKEGIQLLVEHWALTTIVLVVSYVYWHYITTFTKIKKLGLKGPTPLPLIGTSLPVFLGRPFHEVFSERVKKYGKVYGSYFFTTPSITVTDPDILKAILVKDFDKFHDRPTGGLEMPEPLASMITVITGQRWKNTRSVLTPSFTSGKLKHMMFIMNEASDTLLSKLEKVANQDKAVDIHEWQQCVTMEVILSSTFGLKTDSQTNPEDKLTNLARRAMDFKPYPQMALMIPFIGKWLSKKLISHPKYGFGWGELVKIAHGIIKQRREISDSEKRRKDMLTLMLESQNPENKRHHLTDNDILAEMVLFMLAGYDTSSNFLGLTCYNLAVFPETQDRIVEEINQVCGLSDTVTYDDIQKMPYLEACISETLRLYPPGSIMDILTEGLKLAVKHWALSTVILIVSVIYWHYITTFTKIKKLGLKGPTPLPLVGTSLPVFLGKPLHELFNERVKKYGKVYGSYFFTFPAIVVSDLEMLKAILVKDFEKFHDRPDALEPPEPLASMLIELTGQRWKQVRSVLTPSFTSGKLKQMMFIMNEASDTLLSKLENVANKETAVDIHEWQQGVTMEVILSSAFGVKTDSQTNPKDKLTSLARKAMEEDFLPEIALMIPIIGKWLSKKLAASPTYGLKMEELEKIAREVIKQRKEEVGSGKQRKDMLSLMLDSQNSENKGHQLTDTEIIAQMVLFILAGFDTSSNILGLTCYNLAVFPETQDRIVEEINQVCCSSDTVTYDDIQKMPYLEACISETLRLYPPGFITARLVTQSCTINGVPFEKDSAVVVPVYTLHHDEEYWPDPETFKPERFLPENKDSIHPFSYLPFGDGPRNCIGMRFAWMEMKSVLVRMLQKYRLVRGPETSVPIKIKPRAVLAPAEPVLIRIEKRE